MKPRITVLTIGVDDLDRSLAFYRDGLGLPTQGIILAHSPPHTNETAGLPLSYC
ncbi:hypothetical protein PAECIP111893_01440 [Paenibacillus plantiphilus]|uniref:Glyoxalase/Bleomycin resistance-like N-terminal domain-containing protein n=1 Tax=Paenibacillus plantiphilus TaxID=2905650 RepID=A0ABM9C0X6_9BACL|nr:hypothetical protein PAECIP111893_01440 [Paenibacillus plantiphilus]